MPPAHPTDTGIEAGDKPRFENGTTVSVYADEEVVNGDDENIHDTEATARSGERVVSV